MTIVENRKRLRKEKGNRKGQEQSYKKIDQALAQIIALTEIPEYQKKPDEPPAGLAPTVAIATVERVVDNIDFP